MKENTAHLGLVYLGLAHARQYLLSAGPWQETGKGWRGADPERGGHLASGCMWGAVREIGGPCFEGSLTQQGTDPSPGGVPAA